jgi:hypothetical protein
MNLWEDLWFDVYQYFVGQMGANFPGFMSPEDNTTARNGTVFNFHVRNGYGWFHGPMVGNPRWCASRDDLGISLMR